jgi:hypothetical protein
MALNLEKQLLFVSIRVSRLPETMANSRSMELTTATQYGALKRTCDGTDGLMKSSGQCRDPYHMCSGLAIHRYHLGKLT